MKYFYTIELPVNADYFWRIKDTPEYLNFIKKETPFKVLEIQERINYEDTYKLKVKSEPVISCSTLIKKFFGIDDLAAINMWECTINPPYKAFLTVVPPVKKECTRVQGELKITPHETDPNKCIQTAEIEFEVNMFGGTLIQNKLRAEFEKTYKRLPFMISKFLFENSLLIKREIRIEENYSDDLTACMPYITKKIEIIEQYEYISASSGIITDSTKTSMFYTPPPQKQELTIEEIFYTAKKNSKTRWKVWNLCIRKKLK